MTFDSKSLKILSIAILFLSLVKSSTSVASTCFQNVCQGYYFTGNLTGYSWSANRKGIVRPYYASFRRENRTVVVQIDKIYRDGSFSTRAYDVNNPRVVAVSKGLLKRNDIALEGHGKTR